MSARAFVAWARFGDLANKSAIQSKIATHRSVRRRIRGAITEERRASDLQEYSAEAQISESSGTMLRVRKLAIWQRTLPKDGSPPTVQNSDLQSTLAKQG